MKLKDVTPRDTDQHYVEDDLISRNYFRTKLRQFAIIGAIAYLILGAGMFWSQQAVVDKSTNDIIDNAVAICQRGIPVRIATNKNSEANKIVSLSTAQFLEGIANSDTVAFVDKQELLVLVRNYRALAATTPQVPIVDCETEYRQSLR